VLYLVLINLKYYYVISKEFFPGKLLIRFDYLLTCLKSLALIFFLPLLIHFWMSTNNFVPKVIAPSILFVNSIYISLSLVFCYIQVLSRTSNRTRAGNLVPSNSFVKSSRPLFHTLSKPPLRQCAPRIFFRSCFVSSFTSNPNLASRFSFRTFSFAPLLRFLFRCR